MGVNFEKIIVAHWSALADSLQCSEFLRDEFVDCRMSKIYNQKTFSFFIYGFAHKLFLPDVSITSCGKKWKKRLIPYY
jgi:hypothetical protein